MADNIFNQKVLCILNTYDNHSFFENVDQDQVFVSMILIEMGKWGSEEETNIPLFSLMRKIFIVQFHSLLKCSLIFTMGNILSQIGF